MMERYLYINGKQGNLTSAILVLLRQAKKYVKISSFLMQDPMIVDELCRISKSGQAAVFVISNQKGKEGEEYGLVYEKAKDNKKVGFDNHPLFLKKLFYAGIHVRLLDNLHAKFIIADGTEGILMSSNISHNSLMENIESGVELSESDTKELEYVFDVMYNHADIVRFEGARGKDVTVKRECKLNPRKLDVLKGNIRLTVCSDTNTNLSECHIQSLYGSILDVINNAQKFLYIVTWHFKFYEDTLPEFKEAIRKALDRGVMISLYSNTETEVPSVKQSRYNIYELKKYGCFSYGDAKNHSKCVLSETEGIIFTANIDSKSGLTNGFEVGCMLSDNVRKQAVRHVKSMIEEAKQQYSKNKKHGRR